LIENGLRRQIGLWLRAHAQTPTDTVMLEPLGYIGYYSGLTMLDYPGLASKRMVETRRRLGPFHEERIGYELKPDWLVLRPGEDIFAPLPSWGEIKRHYELIEVFDASEKVKAVRWLPGRAYLRFDQIFFVLHRRPEPLKKL
jgi:hypothetical protein